MEQLGNGKVGRLRFPALQPGYASHTGAAHLSIPEHRRPPARSRSRLKGLHCSWPKAFTNNIHRLLGVLLGKVARIVGIYHIGILRGYRIWPQLEGSFGPKGTNPYAAGSAAADPLWAVALQLRLVSSLGCGLLCHLALRPGSQRIQEAAFCPGPTAGDEVWVFMYMYFTSQTWSLVGCLIAGFGVYPLLTPCTGGWGLRNPRFKRPSKSSQKNVHMALSAPNKVHDGP